VEQVVLAGGVDAARVEVRAVIEPLSERRDVQVAITVPEGLDPAGEMQRAYTVQLRGPLPSFRELDALGIVFPVEADVVPLEAKGPDGGKVVEVRFVWAENVPAAIRAELSFDRGVERVNVPPPPPPPEPSGAPL
jgi:hypothetical protein